MKTLKTLQSIQLSIYNCLALNQDERLHDTHSVTKDEDWVTVYMCYDDGDSNGVKSLFEQGIAKDCLQIQQLPIFTCIEQAKQHAKYYYQNCAIIEIVVPQSAIYSWQSYLRLQPTPILPGLIAGCYPEAVNSPCYIQNPNYCSK